MTRTDQQIQDGLSAYEQAVLEVANQIVGELKDCDGENEQLQRQLAALAAEAFEADVAAKVSALLAM